MKTQLLKNVGYIVLGLLLIGLGAYFGMRGQDSGSGNCGGTCTAQLPDGPAGSAAQIQFLLKRDSAPVDYSIGLMLGIPGVTYTVADGFVLPMRAEPTDVLAQPDSPNALFPVAVWHVSPKSDSQFAELIRSPKLWEESFSRLIRSLRMEGYRGFALSLDSEILNDTERSLLLTYTDNLMRALRLRSYAGVIAFDPMMFDPMISAEEIMAINPDVDTFDTAVVINPEALPVYTRERVSTRLIHDADYVMILGKDRTPYPGLEAKHLRSDSSMNGIGMVTTVYPKTPAEVRAPLRPNAVPEKPLPAAPLSDDELKLAQKIGAEVTDDNHVKFGEVLVNRTANMIQFPVTLNLTNGVIEVILCTRGGRIHESLFETEARPSDLQKALYLIGLKNGTTQNDEQSVPKGDAVDVFVHLEGTVKPVNVSEWIRFEASKKELSPDEIIFVGSGVKNGKVLADVDGNLININSNDTNTVLWKIVQFPDNAPPRLEANSDKLPRALSGSYPEPTYNMQNQPVKETANASLSPIQGVMYIKARAK